MKILGLFAIGIISILLLVIIGIETGTFSWSGLIDYFQVSEFTPIILLIFGGAILITLVSLVVRKGFGLKPF